MPQPTADNQGGLSAQRPPTDSGSIGSATLAVSPPATNGTPVSDTSAMTAMFADLEGKESTVQLEILNTLLGVANQVRDGAEDLLQKQPMTEKLRADVESELHVAKSKIDAITRRIDLIHSSRNPRKRSHGSGSLPLMTKRKFPSQGLPGERPRGNSVERDDFRTALHHATSCIKTLLSLARPVTFQPSTSPSSSSTKTVTNEEDLDAARMESINLLTSILERSMRVRYELNVGELVQALIPALSDRSTKVCRASAYRLLRQALVDADSVERLQEQSLDWCIVKSLARDNKHAIEKEQVIKLIRAIVEIGSEKRDPRGTGARSIPLSEPVMRAFIAIAEQPDDPFKPICVQTLAEILLIDIGLMERTGGIRVLLHALAEGPLDIAPILASVFLRIIDSPHTRIFLRPGTDLEIALSGVTDAYGKGSDHDERMRSCSKIIALMLRTWSGLMYFCMNDMLAIRTIIDTLRIPSLESREIILDMFFDLLNIKTHEWYQTFIDGRRLTMYRKSRQVGELVDAAPTHKRTPEPETLKLTDQYIALLVLVLTRAGLLDALTSMLQESTTGSNLTRKATLLMAETLQMANKVLPLSVAASIQSIPEVFDLASDYKQNEHRIIGSLALSAIDSFNRNRARLHPTTNTKNPRPRANSAEDPVRRGQRQVEQVKIKMGMQMDDKTFQASLLETQVMLTKDHNKWNFETLQDLIEGPLLNPKRMEEAIKVSRFLRRLMSFFHPFNHRFSDMPRNKANQRWVRLGCTLLTTLMASQDGQRFLSSEDDFLKQIVKSFAQLDPFNGTPDSDPIFSKSRVQDTLTYGYLEMLGTLSKQKEGIELMEKFKVFTAFYHLSELRSREDLIKSIIQNLDYSHDGHPRIVLSKALTSSYKHIRLFATTHLGDLIRNNPKANAWTLRLLLTQLYDPAPEVCEMAVQFLEEACESIEILRLVVEMQPTLDHLGEVGHPLLLKFMSTPMGFRYLFDAGYIDREMDIWFHERNIYYVVQIEVFLSKAFSFTSSTDVDEVLAFDGIVPRHFYGELAKTELGCQVLNEKGHFAEFAHFIRQHGHEDDDADLILKLKSILWAVGNIGATEGGLPFLEEEEIIPTILEIAEQSLILSVRGTCFFVLGLISSTPQGAEILDDYHWEATLSPLGLPTGLCVPTDLEKFVYIPPWDAATSSEKEKPRLITPTSQHELEVMTAIHNLSNTVIANAASRSLTRMKSRPEYRHIFTSPSMLYRALYTMSTNHYRQPVRRYILDLFDVEMDADVLKALLECSSILQAPPSIKTSEGGALPKRVVSILGRPRRGSESDDDELELDGEEKPNFIEKPVMSLRPVSRIVGFDR
ncbi:hypothetical protein JAAARDRAFT_30208 [Jaapia argillacea MUCL 33604]|uniref:REM-1 domain-containing protein n=1 Tax=Jaapia argillacea MUCL 33604 TaxID=933084 RepID=A0A067QI84_9AGAM|nr:hypothetical protein JAAARDRAFT_30208 [Jaapia argillacea MUCL 33604]